MDGLIEKFKRDFKDKIGNRDLQEWARFLAQDDKTAFEVDHTGTLFKLYILYSYVKWPYLKIMTSLRETLHLKLIFIDLYAGNGLNMINSSEEIYVCGSALLALFGSYLLNNSRKHNGYFDHMIFTDKSAKSVELLERRCKIVLDELKEKSLTVSTSFSSNSNLVISKSDVSDPGFITSLTTWLDSIWSHHPLHVLLFIDPDRAANFKMETLAKLLRYPGDLFLLLHTDAFVEMVNKGRYLAETVKSMLGINDKELDDLYQLKKNKDIAEYYVKRFETVIKTTRIDKISKGANFREIIITTPINTGENVNYYLMYATRKTGGKDSEKWQEAFSALASEIGKMSEVGNTALEVLKGPQKTMHDFLFSDR